MAARLFWYMEFTFASALLWLVLCTPDLTGNQLSGALLPRKGSSGGSALHAPTQTFPTCTWRSTWTGKNHNTRSTKTSEDHAVMNAPSLRVHCMWSFFLSICKCCRRSFFSLRENNFNYVFPITETWKLSSFQKVELAQFGIEKQPETSLTDTYFPFHFFSFCSSAWS